MYGLYGFCVGIGTGAIAVSIFNIFWTKISREQMRMLDELDAFWREYCREKEDLYKEIIDAISRCCAENAGKQETEEKNDGR